MTIDEAIEIQTIHNDHNPDYTDADRRAAHQLGIEALKGIVAWRVDYDDNLLISLPGETED